MFVCVSTVTPKGFGCADKLYSHRTYVQKKKQQLLCIVTNSMTVKYTFTTPCHPHSAQDEEIGSLSETD